MPNTATNNLPLAAMTFPPCRARSAVLCRGAVSSQNQDSAKTARVGA
jgi:hypothetical protein